MNSVNSCSLIKCVWLLTVLITGCGPASSPETSQNTTTLTIVRGGGLPPPNAPDAEFEHYTFTVAEDGSWEWRFGIHNKHGAKRGTLRTDELKQWIKEIEDGGFPELESNPDLGKADESFVDIKIQSQGEKSQKRISFSESLAKSVHQSVMEIAKPGKTLADVPDRQLDDATFQAGLDPGDKRILAFVAWLKQRGITLDYVNYEVGEGGSWRLIKPSTSEEYTVSFSIRSFPSWATEEQMRTALDVNLAYTLNAPEHLAMSHAMFSGTHPEARTPKSDEELPKVNGVPVTMAVEELFKQYGVE